MERVREHEARVAEGAHPAGHGGQRRCAHLRRGRAAVEHEGDEVQRATDREGRGREVGIGPVDHAQQVRVRPRRVRQQLREVAEQQRGIEDGHGVARAEAAADVDAGRLAHRDAREAGEPCGHAAPELGRPVDPVHAETRRIGDAPGRRGHAVEEVVRRVRARDVRVPDLVAAGDPRIRRRAARDLAGSVRRRDERRAPGADEMREHGALVEAERVQRAPFGHLRRAQVRESHVVPEPAQHAAKRVGLQDGAVVQRAVEGELVDPHGAPSGTESAGMRRWSARRRRTTAASRRRRPSLYGHHHTCHFGTRPV